MRRLLAVHGKPYLYLRTGQKKMSAFDQQYGGNHYKDMMIQPLEYALANNLGVCEHAVVKYISRWRVKGGVEDLRKARHYIEILIERETSPNDKIADAIGCEKTPHVGGVIS